MNKTLARFSMGFSKNFNSDRSGNLPHKSILTAFYSKKVSEVGRKTPVLAGRRSVNSLFSTL